MRSLFHVAIIRLFNHSVNTFIRIKAESWMIYKNWGNGRVRRPEKVRKRGVRRAH